MYECGKHLFHLTYESVCAAQDVSVSKMKEIVEINKYEIDEICAINRDMQGHIDSGHKE